MLFNTPDLNRVMSLSKVTAIVQSCYKWIKREIFKEGGFVMEI